MVDRQALSSHPTGEGADHDHCANACPARFENALEAASGAATRGFDRGSCRGFTGAIVRERPKSTLGDGENPLRKVLSAGLTLAQQTLRLCLTRRAGRSAFAAVSMKRHSRDMCAEPGISRHQSETAQGTQVIGAVST